MGVRWHNCPECSGELTRSDKLIEGRTVVRCVRCKSYWLEGDAFVASERVMSASDVVKTLKDRAASLAADEQRDSQMWDSGPEDPRWESYGG